MLFAWGSIASFAHWDSYVKQIGNMHPFHIHVHDALPSLLPHHVVRNAVVVIRARSPFIVSGALHGLDGEKAKVMAISALQTGYPYIQASSQDKE
jgi:hypothetical protein